MEPAGLVDSHVHLLKRLAPHSGNLCLAWLNLPAMQVPFPRRAVIDTD